MILIGVEHLEPLVAGTTTAAKVVFNSHGAISPRPVSGISVASRAGASHTEHR